MKQLYYHNDIAYLIKRRIPHHNFQGENAKKMVKAWMEYLDCDNVLQNPTHYLFVELIPEVEFEEVENLPQ